MSFTIKKKDMLQRSNIMKILEHGNGMAILQPSSLL